MERVYINEIAWDDRGLVAVVCQQHDTGQVLMVAWMDREALRRTLDSGEAWFWSRSRQELWHKGATSGNVLDVVDVRVDCDVDTVLLLVDVDDGAACHTGARSCFHRSIAAPAAG